MIDLEKDVIKELYSVGIRPRQIAIIIHDKETQRTRNICRNIKKSGKLESHFHLTKILLYFTEYVIYYKALKLLTEKDERTIRSYIQDILNELDR